MDPNQTKEGAMKKISLLLVLILLLGVFTFPDLAFSQGGKKVLIIPREGYSASLDLMIKSEMGVMMQLLKDAGLTYDIATDSGMNILGCTEKIENVKRLSDVNLKDYSGILLVCMGVGAFPGPPVSATAMALAKQALAEGKPVAASANSSIILATAGLLKGKKYAYSQDPLVKGQRYGGRTDSRFADAIYSGFGVVQDGLIITSGICPNLAKVVDLPDGTRELTMKFVSMMKK
jgi:putative intracellular protease/amidase